MFFQPDKHLHIHDRFKRSILYTEDHAFASFQKRFQNYASMRLIQVFIFKNVGRIVHGSFM